MAALLVLGVGNMLLTDDGVGVFAAQRFMDEQWPDNVTVREAGTFTQDVFYTFKGFTHIFVLDVVHSHGKPGSIYLLHKDDLIHNESQRLSLHDVDLLDSLHMAEMYFGHKMDLTILGMEPENFTTWNIGLSETVAANFEAYLTIARREIRALAAKLAEE